jgi:hypothetical protein
VHPAPQVCPVGVGMSRPASMPPLMQPACSMPKSREEDVTRAGDSSPAELRIVDLN